MPLRRNRPLTEAYEQEFEQRVMARMKVRLYQFVDQLADRMNDMMNPKRRGDRNGQRSKGEESENPFFEDDGSSSDEQPDRPRRNQKEDNRRWESGIRVNTPEFDGNTLNPERFIDWLVAVEEVFKFKELIGECSKPPKNNDQRAFIGGAWSDNGENEVEKTKDETCLVLKPPDGIMP
ncbi:hypothetical protein Tco_0474076 [Tanacetum coccineum]